MSKISCIRIAIQPAGLLSKNQQKFDLGDIGISELASRHISDNDAINALRKHQSGDWLDQHPYTRNANEAAIEGRSNIVSVIRAQGREFWIVTELAWNKTAIILPREY